MPIKVNNLKPLIVSKNCFKIKQMSKFYNENTVFSTLHINE